MLVFCLSWCDIDALPAHIFSPLLRYLSAPALVMANSPPYVICNHIATVGVKKTGDCTSDEVLYEHNLCSVISHTTVNCDAADDR
jgi:hypothetical protein